MVLNAYFSQVRLCMRANESEYECVEDGIISNPAELWLRSASCHCDFTQGSSPHMPSMDAAEC
jgi:hypothetical protein